MPILDEPKIDCHCHVIDPRRFPFGAGTRYRPQGQEIAPVEHLIRMMDLHGVRHALIVGTNSGYGEDLSPVLDALDRGEGRFKGVAVVGNGATTAELAALAKRGMVGVAFNATFHGPAHYAGTQDLLKRMADLGLFLQLQVEGDQLLAFLPLIEGSGVGLVVDHCGRPGGLDLSRPGFQALLALGRAGRAVVKLSGYDKFSREAYPYADTRGVVRALVEAFTLRACLWGSDWPFLRAAERLDYAPLLSLVETLLPAAADRRTLFWDTPARLLGFPAAP